MAEANHLRQFLLLVFVLLLPCFALWTVSSGPLAVPAIGFVNSVLTAWLPQIVDTLYVDGQRALLMTRFGETGGTLIPLSEASEQLGFPVNPSVLSYSLPFYTALHFATQRDNYLNTWIIGVLVLYPLMALGLLSVCLKTLMVGLGRALFQQPDAWVPDPNLIGLLYQVNVLLVPTLAPVMIWLWQSRETPLLRNMLRFTQVAGDPPAAT
ncbi:MAG: hypothetical protein KDI09_12015 [Halioglobus sp.]|nr:hypothetical protein [Halioglobus sp.]